MSAVLIIADFNGDGRQDVGIYRSINEPREAHYMDIYYLEPQSNGAWLLSASASTIQITAAVDKVTNSPPFVSDIDGDGLPDLVYGKAHLWDNRRMDLMSAGIKFGEVDVSQSVSSSRRYKLGAEQLFADGCALSTNYDLFHVIPAGDLNGDGLGDINIFTNLPNGSHGTAGSETFIGASTLGCFGTKVDGWANVGSHGSLSWPQPDVRTVDLNGDGLADLFAGSMFYLNTGTTFIEKTNQSGGTTPAGDLNGDGFLDLISDDGSSNLSIWLWDPRQQNYSAVPAMTQSFTSPGARFLDFNGDGVIDRYVTEQNQSDVTVSKIYLGNSSGKRRNVVTKISNGLGAEIALKYENVQGSTHYQKLNVGLTSSGFPQVFQWGSQSYVMPDVAAFYSAMNAGFEPQSIQQSLGKRAQVFDLAGPKYVVTSMQQSAPATTSASLGAVNSAAVRTTNYFYGGGKVEGSIRGFLGFNTIRSVDEQTGIQTVTKYRQDFPFVGKPISTEVLTSVNTLISRKLEWWGFQNWGDGHATPPYKRVLVGTRNYRHAPYTVGNPVLATTATYATYDAYLNPLTEQTTTYSDPEATVTVADILKTYTYGSAISVERGLPAKVVVESKRPGVAPRTRTTAFSYCGVDGIACWSATLDGLLYEATVEPNKPAHQVKTTLSYDAFGNRTMASTTGSDIVTRATYWAYDTRSGATSQGRFLDRTTNGLGQVVEDVSTRNLIGQANRVFGLNGAEMQYRFGALGRRYLSYSNDGQYAVSLRNSGLFCPGGTAFNESVSYSGGKQEGTCYDVMGRSTRKVGIGLAGDTVIYTDTEFDAAGRTRHVTEPYLSTATQKPFTAYAYDDPLSRVTNIKSPDGANTAFGYPGLNANTTNPAGQTKSTVRNALGETVSVADHLGGVVSYGYDAEGNTTSIATAGPDRATGVPATITISYTYDDVGRKKTMSDPDKGNWSYAYNVLGELVTQTDAKGQTINVPLPSSGTSGYDALGRMVKRIDKKADTTMEETTTWVYDIAPNGKGMLEHVEQANSGYIKQYSYDTLGRPRTQAVALSAIDGGTHYEYLGYYDKYGRAYKSFDASGSGVQRVFNAQGYLSQILDMSPAGTVGTEHYAVLAMDAAGRITSDRIEGTVTRGQAYDTLGRMTALQAGSGNALQNLTYNYHPVGSQYGNLKDRIDNNKGLTETFSYDGLNRLTQSQVTGQPAVTVAYDSFGNIKSKSDAGTYSYYNNAGPHALTGINGVVLTYDLNGNNTGTVGGRSMAYNTFDKPTSIARSGYTSSFTYGPDRDYYKRVDGPSGNKTIYLNGVEKVYKADGSYDVRRYVPGGALITQKYNSSNALLSTSKELMLKDHLGSTDVIADSNGVLKQAMSFDSWGQRRNTATWAALASSVGFDTSRTAQGYTGHEMVDDLDVVHMHGRIYDSRWGRMLQADPYIQDRSDSQAFNRFAYVNNNPLIHTDPSGYCVEVHGSSPNEHFYSGCDDETPSNAGAPGFSSGGGGGGGVDDSGGVVLPTVGGGIISASRSQAATPGGTGAGTGELKKPIATANDVTRLEKAQKDAMLKPAFQPAFNGSSHCSEATCQVGRDTGVDTAPLGPEGGGFYRANEQAKNLENAAKNSDSGWVSIPLSEAQKYANEGKTVVYAWSNPNGSGHTVTGAPDFNNKNSARNPTVAQVGGNSTGNGVMPFRDAFGPSARPDVRVYVYTGER